MSAPITDARLGPALEAIDGARVKWLSVDVFDTLLWRKVPEPKDVFLVLGRQLAEAGRLAAHMSPVHFAELRARAEKVARNNREAATASREITLKDIYDQLPDALFASGFRRPDRVAAELACETALMTPDDDLMALMEGAKAKGVKLMLISDTYFSSADITAFLAGSRWKGLGPVDRLVVSNEMGRPKWRDLFDHLLKDLKIAPGELFHIGDNRDADVAPCVRLSIPHLFYDKWAFSARTSTKELPEKLNKRAALIDGYGDGGLTGLRSRLWHRAPPELSATHASFWRIGASALSPPFALFGRWIVGQCRDLGATTIHGIMREGRFLNALVSQTAQAHGLKLKTAEIWLSRRAVVRAALYEDDLSLLPATLLLTPGANTPDVLKQIGLTQADLEGAMPDAARFDIRQSDALSTLCLAVAGSPAIRAKVCAWSAGLRRDLLKGLKQALPLEKPGNIVLMDLGYAATIQTALARILKREGLPANLVGLYFALNPKAVDNIIEGADARAFLSDGGVDTRTIGLLTRTPDVLEHACMCRDGSLSHYDDAGQAVFLPNQRDEKQLAEMEALQAGILFAARAADALLGPDSRTPLLGNAALQRQVAASIEAMLLYPTLDEARTIGGWRHEANFDLTDLGRLTDLAFEPAELEYRGFAALTGVGRHQVYWPAAAYVLANPYLRDAYAAGAGEGFTADHLTAGPLVGGLTFVADFGAGFDDKHKRVAALELNAFGRMQLIFTLKAMGPEAIKRLSLRWPVGRAVIALDRVELIITSDSGKQTVDLLSPPHGPAWSGAREIAPGVCLTEGAGAETVLDFSSAIPGGRHALDLMLRLKYLKIDRVFGSRQ
ncbi:MAG: hypothetical protein SFV19_02885 [Rhodospirillaceae bacterium]|nr:hypothetical protein [Rhodospirillaceae bacterium]